MCDEMQANQQPLLVVTLSLTSMSGIVIAYRADANWAVGMSSVFNGIMK
jgi:hypothetical protein